MSDVPLPRTWWIEEGAILGGPFPGAPDSGDAQDKIWTLVEDFGVRTFVNLQEEDELGTGGAPFPDYMRLVPEHHEHEVHQVRVPIADMSAATDEQVERVLSEINARRHLGLVYVHCWGGHGRTGTIAGCHLRDLGLSASDALAQVTTARAHDGYLATQPSPQTDAQRAVIEAWTPQHRPSCEERPRTSPRAEQRARAHGCLLGQLAGDSLGSLVEFQTPQQIAAAYPNGVRELADGGTWNTLAGQPTDDSELALALASSLSVGDRYRQEWARKKFVEWAKSDPFDMGGATSSALLHDAPSETTQANGALMRVSPLGIFGWNTSEQLLVEWARLDAAITHPHPVCGDVNALFVLAIAAAIRDQLTPHELYGRIASWAARLDVDEAVCDVIAAAPRRPPADYLHQQGWVLTAFHNALYQLLHAPTLEAGVVDTVNRGGDTDTNAAIAGALLGAVYGIDAIPDQWRERVLQCRPASGEPGVKRPRPPAYWPVEALATADALVGFARDDEPGWAQEPQTHDVPVRIDESMLRRYVRVLRMVQVLHGAGYQRLRVFPYEHDGISARINILPATSFDAGGWRPHTGMMPHDEHEFASYTTGSDGSDYFDWRDAKSDSAIELARKFLERYPRLAALGAGEDYAYAGWFAAYVGQIRDFESALFWNDGWGPKGPLRVPPPPPPPKDR